MLSWKVVWINALPIVVSALGYVVTSLTPYAAASSYVSLGILVIDEVIYILKAQESPVNQTPAEIGNDSISYQIGTATIQVTPNSPIGTTDVIGGQTFTVGKPVSVAITVSGTAIPAGAVYIGNGEFELNGNFYGT
jgi:hypothetical protein